MNYCRVNALIANGNQFRAVEVECVQQKRLPFLQIIGIPSSQAAFQRERVLAALDSVGFKYPRRKVTVSYLGNFSGTEVEGADFAVALAILGSANLFSAQKWQKLRAYGGLSLDGRLVSPAPAANLRNFLRNDGDSILVPWECSHVLEKSRSGAGFTHLKDALGYLQGQEIGKRKPERDAIAVKMEQGAWNLLQGKPLEQRTAMISAAGGHSLLVAGREADARRIAEAVHSLLPAPSTHDSEEIAAAYEESQEPAPEGNPFRALGYRKMLDLSRSPSGFWEELSLAHKGSIYLPELGAAAFPALHRMVEVAQNGEVRSRKQKLVFRKPMDWWFAGHAPVCQCQNSNGSGICQCLPKYREKHRAFLRELSGIFQVCHFVRSENEGESIGHEEAWSQVCRARQLALKRQGKINARLSLKECGPKESWDAAAGKLWESWEKSGEATLAILRLAFTLRDLDGHGSLKKENLLEARHYSAQVW